MNQSEVFNKVVAMVVGKERDLLVEERDVASKSNKKVEATVAENKLARIAAVPASDEPLTSDEFEYMRTAFREGVPYWAYVRIKSLEEKVERLMYKLGMDD